MIRNSVFGLCAALSAAACASAPAPLPQAPPVLGPAIHIDTPVIDAETGKPKIELSPGVEFTVVEFPSPAGPLHGYLAKPPGPGPFPAFVWNHGSEQKPTRAMINTDFFTKQGFVFFSPHRLGHGLSPGPYIGDRVNEYPPRERGDAVVRLLDEQADQVAAAVTWLRAQTFVDPSRVVLGGCSYGGIQTVLAAERGNGLRGAIDWAGGAMSWGNGQLRERMTKAVEGAKVPIFFVQAENDFSNEPSPVLYKAALDAHHPAFMKVYPAVGPEHIDNHTMCARHPEMWGNDVLNFIRWSFQQR